MLHKGLEGSNRDLTQLVEGLSSRLDRLEAENPSAHFQKIRVSTPHEAETRQGEALPSRGATTLRFRYLRLVAGPADAPGTGRSDSKWV